MTVSTGDRLGVVGINGTGKSTLLSVLAGRLEPGRRGRSAGAAACGSAFLDQTPELPPGTVGEAVGAGMGGGRRPRPAGHGGLRRPRRGRTVGRPGQAGGAGPGAGPPERPARPGRAHQPPRPRRRWRGSRTGWPPTPAAWCSSPTTATCWTGSPPACSSSTGARPSSTRGATPPTSRPGPSARSRPRRPRPPGATWPGRSWPGCGGGPRPAAASPRPGSTAARALIDGRPAEAARPGELDLGAAMARLGDKVIECTGVGVTYDGGDPVLYRGRPAPRPR